MHSHCGTNDSVYTIMVIHGRRDTRFETWCPEGVSICCLASRSRCFRTLQTRFFFKYSWIFFYSMPKKSLPVYYPPTYCFKLLPHYEVGQP